MTLLLVLAAAFCIFGSFKRALLLVGILLDLTYLAVRGMELGRLPLIGPHETLVFFSASIGVMAIPFLFSPRLRKSRAFLVAVGMTVAIFTLLALPFPFFAMPLPPVLKTIWFELHVALAFFAYALFGIGALLAILLLTSREQALSDLQYRAALVGYSFFSASMVTGGIWGYYAWGTYWLWTAKELWTSILWLYYSLYLHLKLRPSLWEKWSAWGSIIGFLLTLFTYLGVSLLMRSSHSF